MTELAERFAAAKVARLATVTPDGPPHLVPIVFALAETTIYTAVDGKPKASQRLRRLANIEANPRVSILVDHYEDDWTQLWWVRADGIAAIHHNGTACDRGFELLRTKYPQYEYVPLAGPVIVVDVDQWSSWSG
ncbi:TIGR03668 family PPOX class F420-dependent oxidoreductase [Mycolicibacterium sphagni]|uniref:PPOX class F420-dependent oxidoreductase n=1 Tax=Mycolicibacterium sphagni TaxID=1786 RepID=A0A255DE71_9MYCO|nr:TIGR03668 family PPOX class F420-dependent oxidoreductase [Mycolicibacterium sphagni]OYN77718.1 PPOX class F420-dependent oxidoreductase [Mycolicibacterium sphagni]